MTILRWAALALALLLCAPGAAIAQVAVDITAQAPAKYLPAGANFCSNDSGSTWVPCPASSGGGGGGSATDTNQALQIALETAIRDRLGASTSPAAGTLAKLLTDLLAEAQSTTPVSTTPKASGTTARTSVSGAASSTLLLATNANRTGCSIVNDSGAILYLGLSTGVSATSYEYVIDAKTTVGGSFECPYGWTGPVYGIWASATGAARIGERSQ